MKLFKEPRMIELTNEWLCE